MAKDIVSARTRQAFREYFVGTTLATIADAFRAAGVPCDSDYDPPDVSGQRRTLVEQYYHSLDFTRWDDVKKLLAVYEGVLDDLDDEAHSGEPLAGEWAREQISKFARRLEKDGFNWNGGRLLSDEHVVSLLNVQDAVVALDAPQLSRQLTRLRDSVNDDPGLAVGTAKEMLETACKTILSESGVTVDPSWDVPALLKQTRKVLKLLPEDIPAAAKGSDTIKRLLSSLGQVGVGLDELRNLYGTGHGRGGKSAGLTPRHARLAVGSVTTLVLFLFETYGERRQGHA